MFLDRLSQQRLVYGVHLKDELPWRVLQSVEKFVVRSVPLSVEIQLHSLKEWAEKAIFIEPCESCVHDKVANRLTTKVGAEIQILPMSEIVQFL